MNTVLLAYLCLAVTVIVAYAISERVEARHYRREHLQVREDDLVYQDLFARLQARPGNGLIVASQRGQDEQRGENNASAAVAHSSSFPGWGAE